MKSDNKNTKTIKAYRNRINFKTKFNTNKNFRYLIKLSSSIIIILLLFFSLTKTKISQENFKFNYFACFGAIARRENLYIRDLISYYLSIGFEKFILGDNNFPNIEKLSDVLQDYINSSIVDIIEVYGSSISQNEFYGIIYEKYKTKCSWISFFDIDEYLQMHLENNKSITIKGYLSNSIFEKCEAICINWLIYPDNNLLYYDNRSVLERFTSPNYQHKENRLVKSIVRGNLNKKIFYKSRLNLHVPDRSVFICNSMGKRLIHYDSMYINPPLLKYAYLMHFTTKTVEEYINKIKRGEIGNEAYNITNRIEIFFQLNNFTNEKLKMFENAFNRSFDQFRNYKNSYVKVNIDIIWFLSILFFY